jgi:hypothetical protein
LIKYLCDQFPSLRDVAQQQGWHYGQGVIIGGPNQETFYRPGRQTLKYIAPNDVAPIVVTANNKSESGITHFHRARFDELFSGPVLLIRRGISSELRRPIAGVIDEDCIYPNSVLGISGCSEDYRVLQVIAACASSSIGQFYHWLTSSSWGVERDEVGLSEHLSFPIPYDQIQKSHISRVTRIASSGRKHDLPKLWQEVDSLAFDLYGLTPHERALVSELSLGISTFYEGFESVAFEEPSDKQIDRYCSMFLEAIDGLRADSTLSFAASWARYRRTHCIVNFNLNERYAQETTHEEVIKEVDEDDAIALMISAGELPAVHLESLIYVRRRVLAFGQSHISIVKPLEQRFWTPSAALNDADEIAGTILKTRLREHATD